MKRAWPEEGEETLQLVKKRRMCNEVEDMILRKEDPDLIIERLKNVVDILEEENGELIKSVAVGDQIYCDQLEEIQKLKKQSWKRRKDYKTERNENIQLRSKLKCVECKVKLFEKDLKHHMEDTKKLQFLMDAIKCQMYVTE